MDMENRKTIKPIEIGLNGIKYTLVPRETLSQNQLALFRQHLINSQSTQLGVVEARTSYPMWNYSDNDEMIRRAIHNSGLELSFLGSAIHIDVDAEPVEPDTHGWSCKSCKHVNIPFANVPCSKCVNPVGRMLDGKYDALDIAKVVIAYCNEQNLFISNLKLQKLLYLLWIGYYKRTSGHLFEDIVYAWAFGPAVPAVYYHYCTYGVQSIPCHKKISMPPCDEAFIWDMLAPYASLPVRSLVDFTTQKGSPWDQVYYKGCGNCTVIPFNKIEIWAHLCEQ